MNKDLLLFLAILSKVLILLFTPSINSDVWYYSDLAQKMLQHQLPYFDFKFEYPPLAILPIWVPGLIQETLSSFRKDQYVENFRFLNFVLDLSFLFFLKYKFENTKNYSAYMVFNICLTFIMAPLMYDRLDLIFGFMIFMVFMNLNFKHKFESLFFSLLAIPFKLITILFVPYYGISFIKDRDFDFKIFWQKILTPALIFSFILVALFQFKFMDFLKYHNDRGVQIESTWATLHFIFQQFSKQPLMLEYSFGAQHLKFVPLWLKNLANYSFLFVISIMMLLTCLKAIPLKSIFLSTLLIFLSFSKVFSPQFLLWFIPLFIFDEIPKKDWIIFGFICLLTALVFIKYGDLMNQKPWAWWTLVARNGLLIYFTGNNFWVLLRRNWKAETSLFSRLSCPPKRDVLYE